MMAEAKDTRWDLEDIAIGCCPDSYDGHGGKLCDVCREFASALRILDEAHREKREHMSRSYAAIFEAKDKAHEKAMNELSERGYKMASEYAEEADRLRAKVREYIQDDTAQYEQVAQLEAEIARLRATPSAARLAALELCADALACMRELDDIWPERIGTPGEMAAIERCDRDTNQALAALRAAEGRDQER